jgi:UDP-N-acetylglucosamine--N-acetylmuramyl-(pentapeptide) pyrophosphoryl-undecaprenol N-acetylglucosamine transferase
MKILLTGGGSGGHITPALAVAHELKKNDQKVEIIYAIGKGDKLLYLPSEDKTVTKVFSVWSGKFRRYHGEGLKQLLDIPTMIKNIRDFFFVILGILQSILLLRREKPDVVFIKGGFVGVPIGLAAALHKIPYITHDSDAIPGLANRIISRWAHHHAVAMPIENYQYDSNKTTQVGVPIDNNFSIVTRKKQDEFIAALGMEKDSEIILITGGGLGAERLNNSVIKIARMMLSKRRKLQIIHVTGPSHYQVIQDAYTNKIKDSDMRKRVIVKSFIKDMYRYTGAADVIVARAGANSLAEFAAQQKACIIIPNHQLTGGHQLKNAEVLRSLGAVVYLSDIALQQNSDLLRKEIDALLDNPKSREKIAKALHATADYSAAQKLATIILNTAKREP